MKLSKKIVATQTKVFNEFRAKQLRDNKRVVKNKHNDTYYTQIRVQNERNRNQNSLSK